MPLGHKDVVGVAVSRWLTSRVQNNVKMSRVVSKVVAVSAGCPLQVFV